MTTAPHLSEELLLAVPHLPHVSASCFAGGGGRVKDKAGEKRLSPTAGIQKDAEQRNQSQENP